MLSDRFYELGKYYGTTFGSSFIAWGNCLITESVCAVIMGKGKDKAQLYDTAKKRFDEGFREVIKPTILEVVEDLIRENSVNRHQDNGIFVALDDIFAYDKLSIANFVMSSAKIAPQAQIDFEMSRAWQFVISVEKILVEWRKDLELTGKYSPIEVVEMIRHFLKFEEGQHKQATLNRVITSAEASEITGIDEVIIIRACELHELFARKSGGIWLLLRYDIEAFWG